MPELSEVDILVGRLNTYLRSMPAPPTLIESATYHARYDQLWPSCAAALHGSQLTEIKRKGKYLLFYWAGCAGIMLSHLRMTGWWAWQQAPQSLKVAEGYTLDRHPRLILTLTCPNRPPEQLIFYDGRVLGDVAYFATQDWQQIPALTSQAPDLVRTKYSVAGGFIRDTAHFMTLVARQQKLQTKRTIRDLLMDQSNKGIGAGLGNYLIAEVLYRTRILPQRRFIDLTDEQLKAIYKTSVDLFNEVIDNDANNDANMVVYQRKQCPQGHTIQRDTLGNRSSYYCPQCQK